MNKIYDLEREKEENDEKFKEQWDKTYEYLQEQFSLERHPTLKLWRNRNKTTCETPTCLKDIRHIKRLEL